MPSKVQLTPFNAFIFSEAEQIYLQRLIFSGAHMNFEPHEQLLNTTELGLYGGVQNR